MSQEPLDPDAADRVVLPGDGRRPWLTPCVPPVPGTVREEPADFEVEEIPLYEPSGEGPHLYLRIEKRGIPTPEAVRRIGRRTGAQVRDIGRAGLKDAHAVTRQTISVPAHEVDDPEVVEGDAIRLVEATRHRNKLRTGHLRGNRFRIRIRGGASGLADARRALTLLAERGLPNAYGPQRFGLGDRTARLGKAVVVDDSEAVLALLLTETVEGESPRVLDARELARAGSWGDAASAFPPSWTAARRAAGVLDRDPSDRRGALRATPRRMRRFWVSAYQSWLFNHLLARRMPAVDRLRPGDVAVRHDSGGAWVVERPAVEDDRLRRRAISPAGPMFGDRMLRARGVPGVLEAELLEAEGVEPSAFRTGKRSGRGTRRPYRVPLEEASVEAEEEDLVVRFVLSPGTYATEVLGELLKRRVS